MKKIEEILEIEEVYTIVEQGVTRPLRVRLNNNYNAIIKYPNNVCGNQVLINEYVCSCIAEKIGIKIPVFGLCRLSKDLINSLDSEMEIDESNSGICFFSKVISASTPITFGTLSSMNIVEFDLAKLIVFDHLICNRERHIGNMIVSIGKENYLYAIDHGTIFTESVRYDKSSLEKEMTDERILDKSILEKNKEMYTGLQKKFSCSCEDLKKQAGLIKEILDDTTMKKIKENVPNEWIKIIGSDIIKKLIEVISCRRDRICEIIDFVIDERGIK